jgi:hypothetical protein
MKSSPLARLWTIQPDLPRQNPPRGGIPPPRECEFGAPAGQCQEFKRGNGLATVGDGAAWLPEMRRSSR